MKKLSILVALLLLLSAPAAQAAQTDAEGEIAEPTPIYTVEEFLSMDPEGSYILMEDLDLTGVEWPCPSFSGFFDGNGHAILNLQLSQSGSVTATSYDGNLKEYDTSFVGLFCSLHNAEVKDLHLLGVQALVEADCPIFLGGLAGYSENSTVIGCTVSGTLELRAFDRMFGVAGIIGYGNGTVTDCIADVTLICTDTDQTTRDEQFMGGIFATGYMDVTGCQITIDGYSSEYGYAHNGGITGMYMQNPLGVGYEGRLTGNTVTGRISFFECNTNRRAYCRAEAGEILASRYNISGNTTDFERDERYVYDTELRPEMCAEPVYETQTVASRCSSYGYSQHTCTGCGYSYRSDYTLFVHTLTQWTVVQEPTTQAEGLSESACDLCGLVFTRTEPVLPEPVTEPAPPTTKPAPTPQPATAQDSPEQQPPVLPWVLAGTVILLAALFALILRRPKYRGKYGRS